MKVNFQMTHHSVCEADEGSVGVDGEVCENGSKGEHQAAEQKTTTTENRDSMPNFPPQAFYLPKMGITMSPLSR